MAKAISLLDIACTVYIDDFILFSPPGLQEIHYKFAKRVLAVLGLHMSDKESGNVLGQYDVPIDILGLDYVMSLIYAEIRVGEQKRRELSETIEDFL